MRRPRLDIRITQILAALMLALPAAAQEAGVTVSHGYSNFGELKHPADLEHLPYANPDAPKGGAISTWGQGTFDSFNIYTRKGVAASNTDLMYEDLMVAASDDPYGLYCYLCETIEYPEDLSYVILNLREEVTFADGTPMKAEDVKFTAELFMEQGITEFRRIVEGFFSKIEVLGPHRIRFDFAPEAPMRDRVGMVAIFNPFSKAWFEKTGARIDESTLTPFMGTGPYIVESYDINRQVIYGRNENWWGADLAWNRGRWNFDEIGVEYFADSVAAFEGFKAGAYTFRQESSSRDWATGYDFRALDRGWVVQEEIADGAVGTRQSFVFNLDKPKWQDAGVRDAIGMMFNFEWSNETLFYGLYDQPVSFWPNSDLAATGAPSEAEKALLQPLVSDDLLPESILTEEAWMPTPHDAAENRPARRTIREANRLLEEAGWEIGADGLRRKDGELLELVFLQFSPLFDRIVNPYIENLRLVGVDAKLERVDNAQYVERRRSGDFDLTNQSFQMGFEPSLGLEQWFASDTADDSSRNLMRLRSEAVDALLPRVIEAGTLDELETATHALDRVLRQANFAIPQWFNREIWVAYYDIFDHPEPLPPLTIGVFDLWWYDAEAAERLRDAGALQ